MVHKVKVEVETMSILKSNGHILFVGAFECFWAQGTFWSAPIRSSIVNGCRIDAINLGSNKVAVKDALRRILDSRFDSIINA